MKTRTTNTYKPYNNRIVQFMRIMVKSLSTFESFLQWNKLLSFIFMRKCKYQPEICFDSINFINLCI